MSRCSYGFDSLSTERGGDVGVTSSGGGWLDFFGLGVSAPASSPPSDNAPSAEAPRPTIPATEARCPFGFDQLGSAQTPSHAPVDFVTNTATTALEKSLPPSFESVVEVKGGDNDQSSLSAPKTSKCPFIALGEDPNGPEFSDANPEEVSRDWRIAYGNGNIERADAENLYTWNEDMDSVSLTLRPPIAFTSKDLLVKFSPQKVVIMLKDSSWSLDLQLYGEIVPGECTWTVCKGVVDVTLQKAEEDVWHKLTR